MKLTQEQEAILAAAAEINQKLAAEKAAEEARQQAEAEAERRRKYEETKMKNRSSLQTFTAAFKEQFPGICLRAHSDGITFRFPNGQTLEITADSYELYPGSCDHTTRTRYTLSNHAGEINTDDNFIDITNE